MNKIFSALLIFGFFSSFAQIAPDTYVIKFKDKKNSKYSIDNPLEYLSQRTVDHRNKFGIPISEQDFPVNESYIKALEKLGLEVKMTSRWLNLAVVTTTKSKLIHKASKLNFVISENSSVQEVKPKVPALPNTAPEFSKINDQENDILDYGISSVQVHMLNANYLHNKGYLGQGMLIAVLDAGFKRADKLPAFDSLFANKQIIGVRDFVDYDDDVYANDSHGMMVLSTMGGNIPGKLIGTAPKADYWLIRTEQAASEYLVEEYYWIAGAEFADSLGCDIIHTSLGYNDFDDKVNNHKYSDMDGNTAPISIGADIAAAKGILVVTSAGNEGFSEWKYISAPADADSVLAIGAVDGEKELAYFSSRGPTFDNRVKPDICAQGYDAIVQGNDGKVTTANGTSFSGPIAAGAVACLWQANPGFTNMQIIDAVRKSADRYEKPDGDYGYGIPDLRIADLYLKSLKK